MNTTSNNLELVYKKDGEGATYAVGQSVVAGQIVEHHLGYYDLGNRMANLKLFSPREDDIILITYPKSGMSPIIERLRATVPFQLMLKGTF